MLCEIRGCGNCQAVWVSWESAGTGERMGFRVCAEDGDKLRVAHRLGGWYEMPVAPSMAELGLGGDDE